jgi:hypothetical protein
VAFLDPPAATVPDSGRPPRMRSNEW